MRIYSALTVCLNVSEVSPLENSSYELDNQCAVRALAELGPSICGANCELTLEDGSIRNGAFFYDQDNNPDQVILTLKPETVSAPIAA